MPIKNLISALICFGFTLLLFQCHTESDNPINPPRSLIIQETFGDQIDLNNLENYASQDVPSYITKDNTGSNPILNERATIGRVLFYDKQLSIDNSISCGSCHQQAKAFGDPATASAGVSGGATTRHTMRLINTRFAAESKFFWDERAPSLEAQTTQPIQNHIEMGFSGADGRPDFMALTQKLQGLSYYNELFKFAYGDSIITEVRMQECLAQFVRSIQSFDSKYDFGRARSGSENQAFPNFTTQENTGKNLFMQPPVFDATGNRISGGLGCNGCHHAPEFDISPNSGNNGVTGVLNGAGTDFTITRAPSLRDMVDAYGNPHTSFMHDASRNSLSEVLNHYNQVELNPDNNRIDPKLQPGGFGQQLHLTNEEADAVVAFLKTLTGTDVYLNKKWSDPFK